MGSEQKKIGLALGGGSARGFAHIGVLQVLAAEQIPVDLVVGTSMGAVIGAFYCAGIDLFMLEKMSCQMQRSFWIDWKFPRMGLVGGEKLEQLMSLLTKRKTFAQLEKKFAVVATDLRCGEKVVLQEGSVARAVRASAAIPGVFHPVVEGDKVLVDGGVVERVPAPTARDIGADFVIAVDVGIYLGGVKPHHLLDVITQSLDIMQRDLARYTLDAADVVVQPQLKEVSPGHFHKAEVAIQKGREAAQEALPQIKALLGNERLYEEAT